MATASAFTQTLQGITSTKLSELEAQRLGYREHTSRIGQNISSDSLDKKALIERIELLVDVITGWHGSGALTVEGLAETLDLKNVKHWLVQARSDPSFDHAILRSWIEILETHIQQSHVRFDCAALFGKLFTEWLSSGDSGGAALGPEDAADKAPADEFVSMGRKEMIEQKTRFSELVFTAPTVDTAALEAYLQELFAGDKAGVKALEELRERMKTFGDDLRKESITAKDVTWVINSLIRGDLMEQSKVDALRQMLESHTLLVEVASVINMRLGFGKWTWPEEGVTVDMRRHLNGKYRAFTDPAILDAILLEYIGVRWEVQFKQVFRQYHSGPSWKRSSLPELPKELADRRAFFLDKLQNSDTIMQRRFDLQAQTFLLSQLPDKVDMSRLYDGESDNDSDASVEDPSQLSGNQIKQKLLHLLVTECNFDTSIYGSHTILRTDLEWFGPSLPHASILTVLKFFGVPQFWLDLITVFLRTPLRFKEEVNGELRVRERGTNISYALSALCGEAVLFGMDVAVNKRAGGLFLYRIHDDLWLWDADSIKVARGWEEMQAYAQLVGLKFNQPKTGAISVTVAADGALEPQQVSGLPTGDIRWGFLVFSPTKGRFVIDQEQVDAHVQEVRRQLAATRSVFGWVNVYNKYMAFLVRNFACQGKQLANCFGRAFVDEAAEAMARVQRALFGEHGGAVGHLARVLEERFDVRALPQAYFYFPISAGGLQLRNPMVEFVALQQAMDAEDKKSFARLRETDEERYQALKATWEKRPPRKLQDASGALVLWDNTRMEEFLTFDEYVARRESLRDWTSRWGHMLGSVAPTKMTTTQAIEAGTAAWKLSWYDLWVVSLYGPEALKRFGSLELVDPTLIPVGMVQLFESSRIQWDQ